MYYPKNGVYHFLFMNGNENSTQIKQTWEKITDTIKLNVENKNKWEINYVATCSKNQTTSDKYNNNNCFILLPLPSL